MSERGPLGGDGRGNRQLASVCRHLQLPADAELIRVVEAMAVELLAPVELPEARPLVRGSQRAGGDRRQRVTPLHQYGLGCRRRRRRCRRNRLADRLAGQAKGPAGLDRLIDRREHHAGRHLLAQVRRRDLPPPAAVAQMDLGDLPEGIVARDGPTARGRGRRGNRRRLARQVDLGGVGRRQRHANRTGAAHPTDARHQQQ